jgi:exopolyphosphatase/guanosine-5'-triphosphate,3'-diphosphate pyrophosphatase
MLQQLSFLFIVFTLISTYHCDDCIEKRNIIEFGSISTKLTVYSYNKCIKDINSTILLEKKIIPFQQCVSESHDNSLSQSCLLSAIKQIKKLLTSNKAFCSVEKCYGFATAWARNAANGEKVISQIQKSTNINIIIISQETEAVLSYDTGKKIVSEENNIPKDQKYVNLDIGGGSFQLISEYSEGRNIYKGDIGAVSLTEELIKKNIFERNQQMIKCKNLNKAYQFIDSLIVSLISSPIYEYLKLNPQAVLFATGSSSHGLSYEFELGNYNRLSQINQLIHKFCDQSFEFVLSLFPRRQRAYMPSTQAFFLLVQRILTTVGKDEFYAAPSANPSDYMVRNIEKKFVTKSQVKEDL